MGHYDADEFAGIELESSRDFAGAADSFQRLWTPHRVAYIENGQQPAEHECPFCLAPSMTDEKALIVARGTHCYVLLNLYPYNSGHLLVCPYRHVAMYDEATSEEVAEIASLTQTAMRVLSTNRTATDLTSASTRAASQVPGSPVTCTSTWCRDGRRTRTFFRSSPRPRRFP